MARHPVTTEPVVVSESERKHIAPSLALKQMIEIVEAIESDRDRERVLTSLGAYFGFSVE